MIKYPLNITIDSNIFDSNMYDFGLGSSLQLLVKYVNKGKIRIYLSNIVINEISKHIKSHAYGIASTINNSCKTLRKEHSEFLLKSLGVDEYLNKTKCNELAAKAQKTLDDFLASLDIQVLYNNNSNIDVDKIFEDYFEYNPPFEKSEKKRKEFPDAFIAAQIRDQFCKDEQLAIISNDKGFKNACNKGRSYLLFDSLSDFFDRLNHEEKNYDEAVSLIDSFEKEISKDIFERIMDNDYVIVNGLSVDNDGNESGYDYDETYVKNVSEVSARVRTIDDMDDEHILATLLCTARISVDCYYDDYDNAVWDSEDKEYIFLETKQICEIHNAVFGTRIDYNIKEKCYQLSNCIVNLGGDTRKERYEVKRKTEYEQYLEDLDRESAGLTPLGKFVDLLEKSLEDSQMEKDIVSFFNDYNEILLKFETISSKYYDFLEKMKESTEEAKRFFTLFLENIDNPENLPFYKEDFSIISKDDVDNFCTWLEENNNELEEYSDIYPLPDSIHFGDTIEFIDADKNKYVLSIDDINITPSEGDTEYIYTSLTKRTTDERIEGYIQLTVGYITFNEDGGIADGCDDDISYFYDSLFERLKDIIVNLKSLLEKHTSFISIISNIE